MEPPPPWQRHYSKSQQREYFWNAVSDAKVWTLAECGAAAAAAAAATAASVAVAAPAPSADPPLPWQKHFSKSNQREYYWHPAEDRKVWTLTECTVPSSAPPPAAARGGGRGGASRAGRGGAARGGARGGGVGAYGRGQKVGGDRDRVRDNSHLGPMLDDEGMVYQSLTNPDSYPYFQDRARKWPFYTTKPGAELLLRLCAANAPLLEVNQRELDACGGAAGSALHRDGERIYSEKSALNTSGVTWTHEEYGHIGMQAFYLRMKSFQRFTETWALLERAERAQVFRGIEGFAAANGGEPLRVASIGGGPAYELFAMKCFFEQRYPSVAFDWINLDVQTSWGKYSELIGFRFVEWDINSGGLLEACGVQKLDYVLISYVLIHVAKTPGEPKAEAVCEMLAGLLKHEGVRAILVSERSVETAPLAVVERRGVDVLRLMDQTTPSGADERQTVWLPPGTKAQLRPGSWGVREDPGNGRLYPNVPFEENKNKKRKR